MGDEQVKPDVEAISAQARIDDTSRQMSEQSRMNRDRETGVGLCN